MDIGVGHGHGSARDMDHQHVRIGGADVVLQHQLVAYPGGRGGQAGVVELERRGTVDARP